MPVLARPTCMRRTLVAGALPVLLGSLLVGCSSGHAPGGAPGPAPTTTALVAEPTQPPTSGPPRTGVVTDHVLTYPDGRRVQLPRAWGVSGIAREGAGYLVADNLWFEGSLGMHRLDAQGREVDTWTGTGPPVVAPDGQVAWVSLVAPESGESGPTLIHAGQRTQQLHGLFSPYLHGFDGRTVTFTATRLGGGQGTYATDLTEPPRRVGTPPRRWRSWSPSRESWFAYRRRSLLLVTPDGPVAIRLAGMGSQPFWEDDRHLLVTYARNGQMAVARIDMTGRLSITTPWRPKDGDGFAFLSR